MVGLSSSAWPSAPGAPCSHNGIVCGSPVSRVCPKLIIVNNSKRTIIRMKVSLGCGEHSRACTAESPGDCTQQNGKPTQNAKDDSLPDSAIDQLAIAMQV